MSDPEIEKLAEQIQRGEDDIVVPEQLLAEPPGEDEETKSLFSRIRDMTVGERIKLALLGNREARQLLVRDSNRVVQRFVLLNPRLTEDEVVGICRNRNSDSEMLRRIADKREWARNYHIRQALVENPKTPLAIALHFVPMLVDRHIRLLAKSKNVPVAIANSARRLLVTRDRKGG